MLSEITGIINQETSSGFTRVVRFFTSVNGTQALGDKTKQAVLITRAKVIHQYLVSYTRSTTKLLYRQKSFPLELSCDKYNESL